VYNDTMRYGIMTPVLWLPLILAACSKIPEVPELSPPVPPVQPLMYLKPGAAPLWFELSPEGPLPINSPEEASLRPFEPWPLARMIMGMAARDDWLVAAVNRDGFLAGVPWVDPRDGVPGIALYRAADPGWEAYTAASPVVIGEIPAVILYRDAFFTDPPPEAPDPRVFGFVRGEPRPIEVKVPAFSGLPPREGWDVETLLPGRDGLWYYRAVRHGGPRPERRYFRSPGPAFPGEASSAGEFRAAVRPFETAEAPPALRPVLAEALRLHGGDAVVTVVSPAFDGPRQFADSGGGGAALAGYFIPPERGPAGVCALIINGEGRGVYGQIRGLTEDLFLPPLPGGFVYTGIGLSGTAVMAAWEEQDGATVGAAGFVVIRAPR
jgi:hypothetical protein